MRHTIILLLISGISVTGFSQSENASDQKLQLGFNFGINYSNLQSDENPLSNSAEFSNALGYQMGILVDYSLTDRLSLNPRVEIAFNNGAVIFPNASEIQDVHEVLPVGLDIITYLIYELGNGKNRPYILLGPDVKLPYLDKVRASYQFSSSTIVALDFGIGLNFTSEKHSFSPELRYSYGFSKQGHPFLKPFQLHSISLVVNVKS